MHIIIAPLILLFLGSACTSKHKMRSAELNDGYFRQHLTGLLNDPSFVNLRSFKEVLWQPETLNEKGLKVFLKDGRLPSKLIEDLTAVALGGEKQKIEANQVFRFRGLLHLLVFYLEQNRSKTKDQNWNRQGEIQHFLAVTASINAPQILLNSLSQEWVYFSETQQEQLVNSLIDYQTGKPDFIPQCAGCPAEILQFMSLKKKLLEKNTKKLADIPPDLFQRIQQSHLFLTTESPLSDLRLALNLRSPRSLSSLRRACRRPQNKEKINSTTLGYLKTKTIKKGLSKQDLPILRGLLILKTKGCWLAEDPTLDQFIFTEGLCKNSSYFLEGLEMEKLGKKSLRKMFKVSQTSLSSNCDLQQIIETLEKAAEVTQGHPRREKIRLYALETLQSSSADSSNP